MSEHFIESGGIQRRFLIHVPAGSAGRASLPVVFNLHGSGGTPEEQLGLSTLGTLADAKGFLVVAPEAVGRRWNVPPNADQPSDVAFMSDALDAVIRLSCADARRVYATGFSGGGRMSSQLACELSGRIAAVAAIGGIRFPGLCAGARPFPILAFHGTADDVNPYEGGGQPYWGTGVEPAIDGWARHNGCASRAESSLSTAVAKISYTGVGCADVVLYRIADFGHAWPGAIFPMIDAPSATGNDILWRFFELHPLPSQ